MSDIYKLVLDKPGYYQFTMPDGFEANVDVYTWGAGGGNGSGAPGGGGGYAASNVVIQTGNVVSVVVGTRGGDASGQAAGAAGTGASIGYNGGSGANQGDPEDGDAGGSGGGGGATAVLVNGTAVAVAAGGGGGGGYGEDGSGGALPGYPGGVFAAQSTGYYQATHPRYCSFLNTYGVWGPFPTSVTINFPVTGTYTFYFSVDNYGSVVLDTTTLFSVYGELNYQTYYTTTLPVNAGNHTLTINPINISGPASVGVQILNPSSVDIWNTLALLVDTGLTRTTNGQNGTQGGAGGSGGGGGGLFGGETGVAYGDDGPGGQGGNGGQNYGDVTIAGTDQTSGGAVPRLILGLPPSVGNATYDGYAILSFTRKMRIFNKVSSGNTQVTFNNNIVANIGEYITQTVSGANALVLSGTAGGNTVTIVYTTSNVFTIGSGSITLNGTDTGNVVTVSFTGNTTAKVNNYLTQPTTNANLIVRSVNTGGNLLVLEYVNTNALSTVGNININGTRVEAFTPARKQIYFSGNISANTGNYITQTLSGGNIANAVVVANSFGNTVTVSYQNANVFVLGNILANVRVNTINANVYPTISANTGIYPTSIVSNVIYPASYVTPSNWKSVQKVYYKTPVAGVLSNVYTKTFSTVNVTTAPKPTTTFDTPGIHTFTVPDGVTKLDLTALGGGGGGGGGNDYGGASGASGSLIAGTLSVTPGDIITVDVGGGGGYGYEASSSSGIGGAGGSSTLGYNGGNGGSETWISTTGGGGGAATVVKQNGTVIAVAAGGGGGGGGGYKSGPHPATGATVSGTAGQNAPNPTGGDVDGGGGGGGGVNGGAGGAYGGGGTSGSDGTNLVPSGFSASTGSNGGTGAGGHGAGAVGGDGSLVIQYSLPSISGEAWTVPAGVKQLTVNYPTPNGIATKLFPVTAGETIIVTLGDFGIDSTIKGTAGTLTLPAYDKQVFTYNGNVDHIIAQNVQVVAPTTTSYSGSGSNTTLESGAAAAGITYSVTYEGWHGDLGASITITPALQSTVLQPVQVYVKNGSGRQYPSAHTYQQQPSVDNGYIMNDYQGDYYGGEGGYSWETWMYQQGYVSITYDQAYAPGDWVPISKVYYKDGIWKPLTSSSNINLTKLS